MTIALRMHSKWTRPCWIRTWNQLIGFSKFEREDARKVYEKHYEEVREVVRQQDQGQNNSKLLEYDVKDGWGPLCEFLEVSVPEVAFPKGNEKKVFVKRFEKALVLTLVAIFKRSVFVLASCWAVVLVIRSRLWL